MFTEEGEPQVLSVSDLTLYLKGILEDTFPGVWVAGEISNLSKPRSGHLYFTIKDAGAQLRAVLWRSAAQRLKFDLQEGQQVIVFGGIEVYPPQGSYQLNVRQIEPQGIGALQLAFEQLQKRLRAEGLFDPDTKRPTPSFPRRIGFVTSPSGAAIRDFIEIALRRWPSLDITVIPARVQGPGAAESIAAGIKAANRLQPALDVLVIGRGGGSMEDLWCFNEEAVVRAIAASTIPTVSAVGHEIDVTLADFAADVRALTPSEAAEKIVPDQSALIETLTRLRTRLNRPLMQRLHFHQEQLRQLRQRTVLRSPHHLLHQSNQAVDELDLRARTAMRRMIQHQQQRLQVIVTKLQSLSPLSVLSRGYSITQRAETNECLVQAQDLSPNDTVITQLENGRFESRVTRIIVPPE